jgi:hypothetical protein
MCLGGRGPSAESMYQERKPEFGELPSLSIGKFSQQGKPRKLQDVKRKGYQARSLLMPTNTGGY